MGTDLEEIKARLNIIDVLGEYIRLEKTGSNFRALCPFHNEKSPSFMVSEEKQIWHCFGCQKGGDIFSFVMEIEGIDFREALKMLAEKAGVKLSGYDSRKTEQKSRTLEILELATKWYEHQLWSGPGKTKILSYLRERGLEDGTIKEFRLGYAPKGWRNILTFLNKRGYKTEEILRTGLLVKKEGGNDYYDRFRERIMFPIADYSGKILGYSARVAPGGDESQAKYVNTPETEVYHKSRVLYGIDKAKSHIKKEDFVLMVEGNMDVIAASQAGIKNVVAVSGTALTEDQVDIVKRYSRSIKMFFDMDSAGENATKKSVKMCFGKEMDVKVVKLPSGKDAADLAKDSPEELKKAVSGAMPAMEYFFENTLSKLDRKKVDDKKKISDSLLDAISGLVSAVEKSHWIKRLAEVLETSEAALTDMLKKANLKNRIKESGDVDREKKPGFLERKKVEILLDELLGLALVSGEVWKKLAEEKNENVFLPKDSLLTVMLGEGAKLNFDFEKLLKILDEEQRSRADRLFFQKKYQLGLNNTLEEIDNDSAPKEALLILKEIKKEQKKEELEKITRDLKVAEERKDKEAIKFLQVEFKKILDEVGNLSQDL